MLAGSIDGMTLPTYTENIGGSSFQIAQQPEADAVLANFRAGVAFDSQPIQVEVPCRRS